MIIRRSKFSSHKPSFVISYNLRRGHKGFDYGEHPMLGADDDDRFDVLSDTYESHSPYHDDGHDDHDKDEGALMITSHKQHSMDLPEILGHYDSDDDQLGINEILRHILSGCDDEQDDFLDHVLRQRLAHRHGDAWERYQMGGLAAMAAKALPQVASQMLPQAASSAASSFGSGMGSAAANQMTQKKKGLLGRLTPFAGGGLLGRLSPFSKGGRVANRTRAIAGSMPNEFDDLVLRDYLESTYGDYDNAGDDLGNEQFEQDLRDALDLVRRQRAMKQHNPRPA